MMLMAKRLVQLLVRPFLLSYWAPVMGSFIYLRNFVSSDVVSPRWGSC